MEYFKDSDTIKCSEKEYNDLKIEQPDNNDVAVKSKKIGIISVVIGGLIMIITALFFAFTSTVPDVIGVNEETAINIIEKAGLIPATQYNYAPNERASSGELSAEYIEKGKVYEVNPSQSTRVKLGSKVNISISKGPEFIDPKEAIIRYPNIPGIADLGFMASIGGDNLRITLMPTIINCNKFKWDAFGYASTNDSFVNKFPVSVEVGVVKGSDFIMVDNGEVAVGEKHYVYIDIPLNSLEKRTLEKLYLDLTTEKDGTKQSVKLSFDFSW